MASNKELDSELVKKSIADSSNFVYIIEKYQEPLRRYIRRIAHPSPDESDILLQDIFIKVYENLNDFNQDLTFSSWIYRIAHNESIDYLRKRKHFGMSLDEPVGHTGGSTNDDDAIALVETLSSEDDIPGDIDKEYLKKHMDELLDKLDPKYRAVLVLKFLEDRDYNEISDILRKPPGTIATLIHRAKKEFRQLAEDSGLEKKI